MMQKSIIRWGILGTGRIAGDLATALQVLPDAHLVAVGSRSQESADAFAKKFQIRNSHPSYEALVRDPEVDVIYVATPHSMHRENTFLALSNGKHVLCEKPFALNAKDAEAMIAFALEKKLFLMEAMWTRFFPLMVKLKEILSAKTIGTPQLLSADFGFRGPDDPSGRLMDLKLGGGALMDVGIYPISLASMILGTPDRITGMAHLNSAGVDETSAFILGHPNGAIASLYTAIRTDTPHEATIMGDKGWIRIHSHFWCPQKLTIHIEGKDPETIEMPIESNGYQFEAAEVMRCIRSGELESPVIPHAETVSILKTLDTIRHQWGLRFPDE
jgi:predicted dehydrogenase